MEEYSKSLTNKVYNNNDSLVGQTKSISFGNVFVFLRKLKKKYVSFGTTYIIISTSDVKDKSLLMT